MRPIPRLRWWIGGLLFGSTTINYIDRQTLNVLADDLEKQFKWDHANVVIAFRIAYAIGQTMAGRLLDWLGTRRGLLLGVTWYSLSAMLTSLASGFRSFALCRFMLGLGEAANWPGAAKTVSEWFPKSERGIAVALYDSGSAIGGAVAGFLAVWLMQSFGSWRPAFLITGALGLVWVLAWKILCRPPETHPWISAGEREMILRARREEERADAGQPQSFGRLLGMKQTWGIILGKSLTDPVWFFITDFFPLYLVKQKGFQISESLFGLWIPFVAADLGNFFGGGLSSWLIRRGWSVTRARKFVILITGLGMALLAPAVWVNSLMGVSALFAVSTFAYAAFSTMCLALPADLYPSGSVASVSGMSGTGAGIGTIISTFLVRRARRLYGSFNPVVIGASVVPLVATALVFLLVREKKERCDA